MNEKLIEAVLKIIDINSPYAVIIVLIMLIALNLSAILNAFERLSSRRNEFLEKALNQESLDPTVREIIEEKRNSSYFSAATGISANRQLRFEICKAIEQSKGEVSLSRLAKVKNHLKLKNGKLTIEIDRVDLLYAYFNWACATALFTIAVFVQLSTIGPSITATTQVILLFVIGVCLQSFALFLFSVSAPILAARKLAPLISLLEPKSS
jgi:hypothetical protein